MEMDDRHGVDARDGFAKKDVLGAIRRYNNEVPFRAQKIGRDTLRASRQSRERSRRRLDAGLPQSNKLIPLTRDVQSRFPEVYDVEKIRVGR